MRRISADVLVDADHDAQHLGPAGSRREKRFLSVSSHFATIPCSIGYFKLTALLDFGAEALPTLPPTILVAEGILNGRAEGHPEPRVVPSDHSHAFPVFEEFQTPQGSQRMNTVHTHPVTFIHTRRLAQGIEDDRPVPARCWSPRRPRSSASSHLSVTSVLSGRRNPPRAAPQQKK